MQNTDMKIGYARVSTEEQNLELQRQALKTAGCEIIYEDKGISGASTERHGLSEALEQMRKDDILVVWKLDRLGRSLAHLINLIDRIGKAGSGFQCLTEAIDTTTAGGTLVFHMMGALAEFERSLIAERTKAGMKAAKKGGKHLGRPRKLTSAQINHAREMIESGQLTKAYMADLYSVHPSTLYRALQDG